MCAGPVRVDRMHVQINDDFVHARLNVCAEDAVKSRIRCQVDGFSP
jgi:hypothetical protein